MQQLLYVSVACHALNPQAVMKLVSQARCRNRQYGITGTLVSSERHFLQLLEGEDAALDNIFDVIRHDARHRAVLQLGRRDVEKRLLPGEDMSYVWTDGDSKPGTLAASIGRLISAIENQDVSSAMKRFARADILS